MITNPEALTELYVALGGDRSDVRGATQNVQVLNKIAALYDGADDAVYNPQGILNIAEVIAGGGVGEWGQYGKNQELIKQYNLQRVYFKDTGYADWTPSGTSTQIAASTVLEKITADLTAYDYVVVLSQQVKYKYIADTPQESRIEIAQSYSIDNVVGSYSSMDALLNNVPNEAIIKEAVHTDMMLYYDGLSNYKPSRSQAGVYIVMGAAGAVNLSSITLRIPAESAKTQMPYFSDTAAAAIDQDASYYKNTILVYRVDKGTSAYGYVYDMTAKALRSAM